MGSGKGASSGALVSYDYYGTIAAILRAGPIDTIHSILIDSAVIWTGPLNRTDLGMTNPYTIPMPDGVVHEGGYVRIYWGDDTQTVPDPALPGHPPYRGISYMVFKDFHFGLERTTAPNIEIIGEALPRPPESVIAATAADGTSGCVNPWAILAELLTSIHGSDLAEDRLDPDSWQAAHDYFAGSSARKLLTYCAPLLTDQQTLQAFCNDLTSLCDGGMRLKEDGTIEAFYYPVDPGDLSAYQTLTDNDLADPKKISPGSWDSVPTGVLISFVDGDEWFINWSVKCDDPRALQQAVEPRRETLQLPFVIRKTQALKCAAEWTKRKCQPQLTGTISVRPERAVNLDGSPLRAGHRFLLDIAPEPGGPGLLQLCRVTARRFKSTGPVTIDFEGEVNQPTVPFTPTYTPPSVEELSVAALSRARLIPIPLSVSDGVASIGVLASRGDDTTVGCHVLFDVDGGSGTFTSLGTQTGFAVPCELAVDYADDSTDPIELTFLDTRDQAIALGQPDASGAQNDELLVAIYHTDGDYIAENADGTPALEWMSIQSSALVSGSTYAFTVLRARQGSMLNSWTTGDLAWIIPKASLKQFVHANFPSDVEAHTDLVFRLSPFSKFLEFDGSPTNLPFHFPTAWERAPQIAWTTPVDASSTLDGSGDLTPDATITDVDGNTVKVSLYYVRDDTQVQVKVFEVLLPPTNSQTLADCFVLANVATPLNFPGRPADDTYYTLTIRAEDSTGNVAESRRSLLRAATGGGGSGLVPPALSPSSTRFTNSLTFTIDISAPATKIRFFAGDYGGTHPPLPTPVVTATHLSLSVQQSVRMWARAEDGSGNVSAWVFADYLKV